MLSWTGSPNAVLPHQVAPCSHARSRGQDSGATAAGSARAGRAFPTMGADIERLILPGVTHWRSARRFLRLLSARMLPVPDSQRQARQAWAYRGCCGRPVRRAPNWKRMCWIGWSTCSACPRNFFPAAAEVASFRTRLRARPFTHCWRRVKSPEFRQQCSRRCDGKLVAFTSSQAPSSLEKRCQITGIGKENLRAIEVDEKFAIRPER